MKNLKSFLWSFCGCFFSALNDLLTKISGLSLPTEVVIFFRFTFGCIALIPLLDIRSLKSCCLYFHILRALMWVIGIFLWAKGANYVPIYILTIVSFLIPIFNIILARFFLGENIDFINILLIFIAFLGIILTTTFSKIDIFGLVLLIIADLLFSLLDLTNKILTDRKEPIINMLFLSNLFSSLLTFPFVWNSLLIPSTLEIGILIILSISGNLILLCILRSFSLNSLSSIQYIRYLEFPISCILSYFFFADVPDIMSTLSCLVIISSSSAYYAYSARMIKRSV
ncbi:DMT family transporter [Candidatus Gromoviella agglomerans]|uniref:DMT family transporter n=1 Tax=Candidatus Gromoviella agglomerans TaxID=2806609 RepID=UPI001E54C837|nr:DMT family transporter [Candidatus Gromoviella agglomerans]UFX98267.1 DMT family transporter [Candidatus Gromoviella agglomerans]